MRSEVLSGWGDELPGLHLNLHATSCPRPIFVIGQGRAPRTSQSCAGVTSLGMTAERGGCGLEGVSNLPSQRSAARFGVPPRRGAGSTST